MATLPKKIYRNTLPVSGAFATCPAGKRWIVTNIVATNKSASTATFRVELNGVSLVHNMSLATGALFTLDCTQVMEESDWIDLYASIASAVTIHISGVEMDTV